MPSPPSFTNKNPTLQLDNKQNVRLCRSFSIGSLLENIKFCGLTTAFYCEVWQAFYCENSDCGLNLEKTCGMEFEPPLFITLFYTSPTLYLKGWGPISWLRHWSDSGQQVRGGMTQRRDAPLITNLHIYVLKGWGGLVQENVPMEWFVL